MNGLLADGYGVHTKGARVGSGVGRWRAPHQSLKCCPRSLARPRPALYPCTFCKHPYALCINICEWTDVPTGSRLWQARWEPVRVYSCFGCTFPFPLPPHPSHPKTPPLFTLALCCQCTLCHQRSNEVGAER